VRGLGGGGTRKRGAAKRRGPISEDGRGQRLSSRQIKKQILLFIPGRKKEKVSSGISGGKNERDSYQAKDKGGSQSSLQEK